MNNKKEDKNMGAAAIMESEGDPRLQLSLKQVHNYTDRMVDLGRAEYNKGSILMKSKHPLDECFRRGIIEEQHHDSGKRIRNYRDCALSKLSGRTYNAPGEGDPEMDAATIYANVMRTMNSTFGGRNYWKLIALLCFAEPDIDGGYYNEEEYGYLYQLGPNIQRAFETADETFAEARAELKRKIEAERSRLAEKFTGV